MGDLTFFVPPEPAAAPQPASAADAGPAVPRLRRRVHFCDLVASPHIWFDPPADAASTSQAEPPPPGPPGPGQKETAADELMMTDDEDKMDLLWEDFNEELLAMRRAGLHRHDLSSSDDGEEDSDSAAGRVPPGCFPVLRPAARAGLAGHYRRRAGTWVLLMRIFRRLFVIDKTITSSSSSAGRHAATGSSKR